MRASPFTFGLTYLANSIYANSGLSIDIVPDGVNPNDKEDGTGFGNKTQNYPELTSAHSDGDRTTVRGTLNSTPNAIFRVEFFANEKTNATRYGDGQRYLGAIMVGTDSDGNADIIATLEAVSTGQFISATATRPGYNTSEFSQVVEVNPTASGPSARGPSISTATTNANDQAVPPRGGPSGTIQSFSFAFDQALDPCRAVDLRNFHLFAIGRNGVVGSSKGRTLALRSATYNSSTHTVTLIPSKSLGSGLSFKVVVDGTSAHGVSDTAGRLIDGNGDGEPGGDYVVVFARGKALSYRDRDGDVVSIKLRGGGVLELSQRADGTIQQLRVVGAVPGRSVLSGRVVRSRNGNGRTTLGRIAGLGGVKNLLRAPLHRRLTGQPDALFIPLFVSPGTSMGGESTTETDVISPRPTVHDPWSRMRRGDSCLIAERLDDRTLLEARMNVISVSAPMTTAQDRCDRRSSMPTTTPIERCPG